MSRIGKKIIQLPTGVTVVAQDGIIHVKGPKGELSRVCSPLVYVSTTPEGVMVDVKNKEDKKERSLWGTFGSHITNMVRGVSEGFKKQLEINGVGYKATMQGKDLKLDVGFSHPVLFPVPSLVSAQVEKNMITLESIDKELLGALAAKLRSIRPPEPYKGKGIKYLEETIRRKAGKAAKAK